MTYTVQAADLSTVQLNEDDYVASKLQEIALLLSTRKGEIPMYRSFGLPQRFLDMPANAGVTVMIMEVREAIEEFVPGVEVIDVIPAFDSKNPGKLVPAVEVKILNEQES